MTERCETCRKKDDQIKALKDELKTAREKLADYKGRTRFVWDTLASFRALVSDGMAGFVPESVRHRLSNNPPYSFKPSKIEWPDGTPIWTLEMPATSIPLQRGEHQPREDGGAD